MSDTNFDDPSFDGASTPDESAYTSPDEGAGGSPSHEAPEGESPAYGQETSEETYHDVPNVGKVPQSELYKGYLRTADYTRKTQQLAARAREFESWQQEKVAYDQTLDEIRGFLQDPARMQAYLAALGGGQPAAAPPPELDPNEILTASQARDLFQRELGARLKEQEGRFSEQMRDQQVAAFRSQYSEAVDTKLGQLAQKYPELRQIPGMDIMLREAVRSRQPKTIQQALALFDQAALFYSSKLDVIAKARIASNQGRTNPVNRGIEPPNGRTPMPKAAPSRDDQFTGVRDPNLRNVVINDINRILQAGRT